MGIVTQAYRFELDPNNAVRSALASHAGAARFAFNWGLAQRTYHCEQCGLVIDRDLNLASLVEATGTASGAGTGQGSLLANAQGEEKFMPAGRCSSPNCEDGTGPVGPGKTATAAEQSTAA